MQTDMYLGVKSCDVAFYPHPWVGSHVYKSHVTKESPNLEPTSSANKIGGGAVVQERYCITN